MFICPKILILPIKSQNNLHLDKKMKAHLAKALPAQLEATWDNDNHCDRQIKGQISSLLIEKHDQKKSLTIMVVFVVMIF